MSGTPHSGLALGVRAGTAGADAVIAPHEIEATFVSLFNNGFSAQDFPASLVLQHVPELRFKPITRFENAWRAGERPLPADYLDFTGAERRALLVELVHADLHYRLNRGRAFFTSPEIDP